MKKSLLMKSISILLVLTLMTSTITFCLGGCSVKITPNRADIDIPTYFDTRLEVSSQNVSNNYAALTNALKSNNTEEIKEKADALKDAVNQSLSEFKLYSEEISSMIGDSDDIIKKRAEEFEKYFNKNSQKALDAINGIILGSKNTNSQSYQQSIDTLEKYFEVEKEIMVTSDNLENSISKKTDAEKLSVNNLNNYVKNSVSAVGSSRINESSLKLEDEISLTDEMKALADQLKTPLQVYLYLKNHINYEAYSDSRKGAVATFDSNGGNDVDQASLLIAMLRYLNYPAKYVNGTIFISADQALKLTSAKDLNTAGTILASSGKKVFSIVSGGKIEGFQMDQTWVEAYVPYTDYRGAGNAAGDYRWIPLDTSIKSESDYVNGMSSSQLNALYEKLSAYEKEHEGEEAYLNSRQIISESTAYLPLPLQYVVKSIDGEYDKIKERDSDTITFTIDGQNIAKLKPYEMYGKWLIVEYVPATDSRLNVSNHAGYANDFIKRAY